MSNVCSYLNAKGIIPESAKLNKKKPADAVPQASSKMEVDAEPVAGSRTVAPELADPEDAEDAALVSMNKGQKAAELEG